MNTSLAAQTIRSLTPLAFTQDDVQHVRRVFDFLASPVFAALASPDCPIAIDTCEQESDTLNIGGYSIQSTVSEVPHVASATSPRFAPRFVVSETVHVSGSYWEPDDVDLVEFCDVPTLHDALVAIAERELRYWMDNHNVSAPTPLKPLTPEQEEAYGLSDIPY